MDRPDPASQSTGRIPADRAGLPQDAARGRRADGFQRHLEQANAAGTRGDRPPGADTVAETRPQVQPFAEAAAALAPPAEGQTGPGPEDLNANVANADDAPAQDEGATTVNDARGQRRLLDQANQAHPGSVRSMQGSPAPAAEPPRPAAAAASFAERQAPLRAAAAPDNAALALEAGRSRRGQNLSGAAAARNNQDRIDAIRHRFTADSRYNSDAAAGPQPAAGPPPPPVAGMPPAVPVVRMAVTFSGGRIRTLETLMGQVEFSHSRGLTVANNDPQTHLRANVHMPQAIQAFRAARPDVLPAIVAGLDPSLAPAARVATQNRLEGDAAMTWISSQLAASPNLNGIPWATHNAYRINSTQDIPAANGPYREVTVRTGDPTNPPRGTLGTGAASFFHLTQNVVLAISNALVASAPHADPRDRYRAFYHDVAIRMPSFLPFLDPPLPPPAPPSSPR